MQSSPSCDKNDVTVEKRVVVQLTTCRKKGRGNSKASKSKASGKKVTSGPESLTCGSLRGPVGRCQSLDDHSSHFIYTSSNLAVYSP